jgi:hypothetical protein
MLVLADSFYPGWRALYEDGGEGPAYRANYAFRAAFLVRTKQIVTFRYVPATFRIGLFVSLLACAALAAAAMCVYLGKEENVARTPARS